MIKQVVRLVDLLNRLCGNTEIKRLTFLKKYLCFKLCHKFYGNEIVI